MVAKPLCPLYKNIIKPLDRARYPELRYEITLLAPPRVARILAIEKESLSYISSLKWLMRK